MNWIKESINEVKKNPMQAVKDFAMCVAIFVVCGVVLFLSAILQGCSVVHESASNGKATIITTDTTHIYHGGMVKFPKSL